MKLKTKPSLPSSSGKRRICSSRHPRRVPAERRRQVVREHRVGELRVDRVGEDLRVVQVGRLRLHPEDVGVRRRRERLGDRVLDAAAHLVVAVGRLGVLAVPHDVHAHAACAFAPICVERRARARTSCHSSSVIGKLHALAREEAHHVGDRLAVRLHVRLGAPDVDEAGRRPCRARRPRRRAPPRS